MPPGGVQIGNGFDLSVFHRGHSNLAFPSCVLHLNDLLHVPDISYNLLFVHKLCTDNNAFVEFHPSFFFVKDQTMKGVLLQGHSQNDFYKIRSEKACSDTFALAFALSASFPLCTPDSCSSCCC